MRLRCCFCLVRSWDRVYWSKESGRTRKGMFFIELSTRRVHYAGCTTHPDSTWVTQQARQLVCLLEDEGQTMRFLIHPVPNELGRYDRDSKFTHSFDTVPCTSRPSSFAASSLSATG